MKEKYINKLQTLEVYIDIFLLDKKRDIGLKVG